MASITGQREATVPAGATEVDSSCNRQRRSGIMAEDELMGEDMSDDKAVGFTAGGVEMSAVMAKQMVLIDQMIAWQLSNPGKPWTQCAQALGVTALWCRMMASTDAYRARYHEVSDQVIREVGLFGLRERIAAAAEMALDRLAEKIPVMESASDLTDAAEMLLNQHYGKTGAVAPANQHITINQALILQGREQIMGPKENPPIEGTSAN